MLTINTNLSSLIAQSSMKSSTNKLNQAIERMTTGFKINHAKDNAANYSIATNMTTKISAYNVAEDNAAMGLDLISTAEGTLSQIEDKLQRLRALQEQASNGTYGEQSLNALNAEANALVDEINRLYSTADYNGLKLFGSEEANQAAPIAMFAMNRSATSECGFIADPISYTDEEVAAMTTMTQAVAAGSLVSGGVYSISTVEELVALADYINAGNIASAMTFVLGADIDLSSISNWTPIGKGGANIEFTGTFDGNGHVISNLTINDDTNFNYCGLFGYAEGATIQNVALTDAMIEATSTDAGVLVGHADAIIVTNCYATGSVYGRSYAAGLLSFVDSEFAETKISNSWTDVDVEAEGRAAGFFNIGSEVFCNMSITNCYSLGDVHSKNIYNYTFGIAAAGFVSGVAEGANISNCYSSGAVTSIGDTPCGFAYSRSNNLTNCYWDTQASGVQSDGGGAIGVTTAELNELINNGVLPAIGGSGSGGGAGGTGTSKPTFTPAPDTIVLQIGAASNRASQVGVSTKFSLLGVDDLRMIGLDLTTDYLTQIDDMLGLVSEKQTHFGATSNRLESVLEEITIQRDNLVSSRSTIRDADIAEVSSTYIQQQILQQASATLLATANQSPSIALQLI